MIIYPILFMIIFFAGFSDAITTHHQDGDAAPKTELSKPDSKTKP